MYLLTETASPFAFERWAAFFANFVQFVVVFYGISILTDGHVMIPIS